MDDVHDLTALYVVDALDDLERRRYESHLPDCERCQTELDEFDGGFGTYVADAAEPAPRELKRAVMDAIARPTTGFRVRRRLAWATGGAAAVAVVVVAAGLLLRPSVIEQVYAAPDAVVLDVEATPFQRTEIVYSESLGRAVFVGEGLPDPGAGRTYQLWLIDDQGPHPAGIFVPEDGRASVLVDGTAVDGVTIGLTVEPEGGSASPTGEVLVAEELA